MMAIWPRDICGLNFLKIFLQLRIRGNDTRKVCNCKFISFSLYSIIIVINVNIIIIISMFCRSFTANSGTKAAVLPKGKSSTTNSGTKVAVLLGMNRCGSFPLLSAPHSLSRIWTDLKKSQSIPGTPAWWWEEGILLTKPSGLHWNSPRGLNICSIRAFDHIRDSEIPLTLRPQYYILMLWIDQKL